MLIFCMGLRLAFNVGEKREALRSDGDGLGQLIYWRQSFLDTCALKSANLMAKRGPNSRESSDGDPEPPPPVSAAAPSGSWQSAETAERPSHQRGKLPTRSNYQPALRTIDLVESSQGHAINKAPNSRTAILGQLAFKRDHFGHSANQRGLSLSPRE